MWVGRDYVLGFGGAMIRVIRIFDKRLNGFYYTIRLLDMLSAECHISLGKMSLHIVKAITG